MQTKRLWLVYALITMVAWGIWGAYIDHPATPEEGVPGDPTFPPTLGYIAWSLTMIPPALVGLCLIRWQLDTRPLAILQGMSVGLLGAAGQLVLFQALRLSPAYLVFAFVSLSPVITILLAAVLGRERANWYGVVGVVMALVAGVLLSPAAELIPWGQAAAVDGVESAPESLTWILLSLCALAAWGIQGYLFSSANKVMQAESIFFYMMVSGILLAPIAWWMTDFSQPIDWNLSSGPGLSAAIHLLNAVGALLIVYAFRYGKAMFVAPLTNAGAPAITILLSLIISSMAPTNIQKVGLALAVIAATLMAVETDKKLDSPPPSTT